MENLTKNKDVYDILELFGDLEELEKLSDASPAVSSEDFTRVAEGSVISKEKSFNGIWRRFEELTVDLWNSGLGLGDNTGLVSLLLLIALLLVLLVILLVFILVCRCLRRRRQSTKTRRQNSTSHLITKEVNKLIKAGSDFTKIGAEVIKIESDFEAGSSPTRTSPSSWESWSLDSLEERDRLPLGGHACVV